MFRPNTDIIRFIQTVLKLLHHFSENNSYVHWFILLVSKWWIKYNLPIVC
jgi:hypothetical protein